LLVTTPTAIDRLIPRRIPGTNGELFVAELPGDGPSLVLVHGIGSRHTTWWPVLDALGAHFRLLMLDLRGHGASDKPPSGYLYNDYAVDLAALIDQFDLEHPLVLGHSLGAMTALTWAVVHPERAAGIALEDPPLRSSAESAPKFDNWLATAAMPPAEVATQFARENPHWSAEECRLRAESITSTTPAVFQELRAATLAGPVNDRIATYATIQSPVLMVHGDLEMGGVIYPEDIVRFGETLPHARVVRFAGAGHSLHRENTEAFLEAVVPFLLEATR
jgi:pimeloyl-ACP methyl ester carboxylesterase